jgi:hypothetical protein
MKLPEGSSEWQHIIDLINDTSKCYGYIASQDGMLSETLIRTNVEGTGRGLIKRTIRGLAQPEHRKLHKHPGRYFNSVPSKYI